MVAAVPRALELGLLTGSIGLAVGVVLGFVAGYMGGIVDNTIRGLVDTILTVPSLVILVTIAASLRQSISVEVMALIVALLSWMVPTRTIRAQVQTIRLRRESTEEYKRIHVKIWPEIEQPIRAAGITNYSIFLKDGVMFAYFEYTG